ncbi:MAG: hypothetical protein PHG63_02085 [Candidatus Dojkabacteria bacterium]|nr:hypothetical protein [Candidatus Dojkabacteria bacterium]
MRKTDQKPQRQTSGCGVLIGAVISVFVNLIMLYVISTLYPFFPFVIDEQYIDWIPFAVLSILTSIFAEIVRVIAGKGSFLSIIGDMVRDGVFFSATLILYEIFPFDLSSISEVIPAELILRIALIAMLIGSGIGIVSHIVRIFRKMVKM